jgi:hypothetical protein
MYAGEVEPNPQRTSHSFRCRERGAVSHRIHQPAEQRVAFDGGAVEADTHVGKDAVTCLSNEEGDDH